MSTDDTEMVTLRRADVLAIAIELAIDGVGLFRHAANKVLEQMGLPRVPLNASREEARTILKDAK